MAGMQPIGQEHAQPYGNEGTWEAPEAAPKVRSIGVCILLYIVTLTIYGIFWVYNVHRELPKRRGVDLSSGAALGLMLFPVVGFIVFTAGATFHTVSVGATIDTNVFSLLNVGEMIFGVVSTVCMFFVYPKLTDRINLITKERLGPSAPLVARGLVIAALICGMFGTFPYIKILSIAGGIMMIIWWVGAQQALNRLAEAAYQEQQSEY